MSLHPLKTNHTILRLTRLCGTGFVLQLDNDPKYTYHMCENYLGRKQEKGCYGFSSSISGTKSYWEIMGSFEMGETETWSHSKDNLWDVFNQCWNNLSQQYLEHLLNLKAVFQSAHEAPRSSLRVLASN
jgi:hypothetical protein